MKDELDFQTELRLIMVEIGRRMWQRGFVAANDGNMSVRLNHGKFLVTPSGISKGFIRPEQLLIIDESGQILAGEGTVTTELKMHLAVYRRRPDVGAVVHAHPIFATTFAAAEMALDQLFLTETLLATGPVPLAPYATPSTEEVPASIEGLIEDHDALLLSRHGVLTVGKDLQDAYFKLERVEHCAHIHFNLMLWGHASELSGEAVQKLLEVKARLEL